MVPGTFQNVSIADIAQTLASGHGLTASVGVAKPIHRVVAQVNQSDLAFLRSQARMDDCEVWVDGTTLHVDRRPDRARGALSLAYGGGLISFSVRADLADQCHDLGVAGWDVDAKAAILETVDATALGGEIGADSAGATVLAAAMFPGRSERIVRGAPMTSEEAASLAQAAYLERARRFVCGTGLTDGTAAMRVGSTLTLSGLGGMFNGNYYVSRTRHHFDLDRGYQTEFDVERPGIGRAQ